MASSDVELKNEVKDFLGPEEGTISDTSLDTALTRAKSYISTRKQSLDRPQNVNWYDPEQKYEEALFWNTCLYAKIITGELDAPGGVVGDIETDHLNAKQTEIYRNAKSSLANIGGGSGYGIRAVTRSSNRNYSSDGNANL